MLSTDVFSTKIIYLGRFENHTVLMMVHRETDSRGKKCIMTACYAVGYRVKEGIENQEKTPQQQQRKAQTGGWK